VRRAINRTGVMLIGLGLLALIMSVSPRAHQDLQGEQRESRLPKDLKNRTVDDKRLDGLVSRRGSFLFFAETLNGR
jgi:hypothetical protein